MAVSVGVIVDSLGVGSAGEDSSADGLVDESADVESELPGSLAVSSPSSPHPPSSTRDKSTAVTTRFMPRV